MSALRCLAARSLGTSPAHIVARKYTSKAALKHDLKPTCFGQPLFASHPHLIRPNEITPGISAEEYEQRRKALMERLPEDSLVVSVSAEMKYMSGQIFYKFRQASDFWYLTGFEEPDSAMIMQKNSSTRGYHMTLFSLGKDSHKEKWEGARTSRDDSIQHFGADDAQSITSFLQIFKSLRDDYSYIYVDMPPGMSRRGRPISHKTLLKYLTPSANSTRQEFDAIIESISPRRLRSLAPEVAKLRAIKSNSEQKIMRDAADISGHAHAKTMRFTGMEPGKSEHELAAHFEYLCAVKGSQRPAYVPVVASGPNALIIHYTSNNQIIRQDEMILIDAGCEFNGYASDITRTFPAAGTFSTAQAALYNAVLQVQKYLISLCTETTELNKIGFNLQGLSGVSDLENILYPHYIGHPVGIDLHESSHFERNAPLKAGMVVTIEPGIYVPQSPLFPKEFHNIGIRIEDEVLVGKDHPTVLSVAAPKEIEDVEGACKGLLGLGPF